jgi:hypothetical protein
MLATMGSTCKKAETTEPAETPAATEQSTAAPANADPAAAPAANPANDEGGMGEAGEIKEGASHED